jgi:phage terminase large subunit-like protein
LSIDLGDFLGVISGDEFEEKPVGVREFVTTKHYLDLPPLSENQYKIIEASSQIYKRSTLHNLYGYEEGEKRWKQTYNEVVMQLGKGSGKDYTSTIACAYIVYLLLCLKDPARYYGKPPGDSIDILNIAINSQQAKNVFFKGFKDRITKSPWFAGKFSMRADNVTFDKNVTVHSGHSERESWEGYNVLLVILDEIAGFAIESTTGNEQAKTADAIYNMYRASVDSRFPDYGKVLLLSFPRYVGDFIQQRYADVIGEKETIIRTHTYKIDDELPDGVDHNEFEISWEEDRIISYRYPRVFAMKRPTWEVNPTRDIEDFKTSFMRDPVDSLGRFACMPPEAIDAFFKSREKIEAAFKEMNMAIDETGRFAPWFKPEDGMLYYIHVDLAQKHDRCAVALAHVDHWRSQRVMGQTSIPAPFVVVDAVRYWTPTTDKSVDFTEVKDYILDLKRMGFDIRLVTFDRWNSHDMMQQLKEYGMKSETLSVAKKHYEDMALAVYEDRLRGPALDILIKELLRLRINKDKVDHPRQGSKDLADAVCGAIYNSISLTPRNTDRTIEVYTPKEVMNPDNLDKKDEPGVIRAPSAMPQELSDAMSRMRII